MFSVRFDQRDTSVCMNSSKSGRQSTKNLPFQIVDLGPTSKDQRFKLPTFTNRSMFGMQCVKQLVQGYDFFPFLWSLSSLTKNNNILNVKKIQICSFFGEKSSNFKYAYSRSELVV